MPAAKLKQRVMFRPEDMLALVAGVEDYPKFISLISALRVTKREETGDEREVFEAEAIVAFKFLSETFRSIVEVDHAAKRIVVKKADKSGAVKSLSNHWVFHELSDGSTLIDFAVDVRLKAFPLEMLVREKFDKASQKIMNMFIAHAEQTYDKVGNENLDLASEIKSLGLRA